MSRQGSRSVRFGRREFLAISAATTAAATLPGARALAAAAGCHPTRTEPVFLGRVPTPSEALGYRFGVDREVWVGEVNEYLSVVAAASDRVRMRTLTRSHQGRKISYAIVGRPQNVTPAGLAEIQRAHREIRDPDTPWDRVRRLAATTPAFLWVCANIHGNEESGTDAALDVLHGLADRTDCVVDGILRNAVVVVLPMQNPDGRALHQRRNAFAFDLNRDHLSRTQPETDAKVELMRRYPPLVLLDHHEFGYLPAFFPPNDDPVYHEVTDEALHFINDVYGPAIADEFERKNWKYFNRGKGYDFFSPIFTDTLASDGFQGVGMTIEVNNDKSIQWRYVRQRAVMWITLAAAAARRRRIFDAWHRSFVEAVAQGRRGELLPNKVFESSSEIRVEVPTAPLRHYFIRTDAPHNRRLANLLARQLQRMDVQVSELREPLAVPDYHPHTLGPRAVVLPEGTFWIPMAQPQKHWIQAAMNEDAYVPIASAYGLTGFSLGLLSGAEIGWSGAVLTPQARRAAEIRDPGPPNVPANPPRVRVWQITGGFYSWEGTNWLRFLLEHVWGLDLRILVGEDIADGALDGVDVLISPSGGTYGALKHLGERGQRRLVRWVNDGGRYVGWRWGSAQLPYVLGLTDNRLTYPRTYIRDILLRVMLDQGSPLAKGLGNAIWMVMDGDVMMMRLDRVDAPDTTPGWLSSDPDGFAVNGVVAGTRPLRGKGVITDEPVGDGRVIVSALDLNWKAETVGAQKVLWNAIFGEDPTWARQRRAPVRFDAGAVARRAAQVPHDALPMSFWVTVGSGDAAEARAALRGLGADVRRMPAEDGEVTFVVANPEELSVEEHRFAGRIPFLLQDRGIDVRGFRGPA
jgi:hypothetical protein